MGALDKERVLRYEAEIREAQRFLGEMTSGDVAQFVQDGIKIRALKYTLIILVEAICNLCRLILAKKAYTVIEEYVEAVLKMHEKGMLSEKMVNQLIPLTKLRHQLIHGYWKTDDKRLFAETKSSLGAIDSFIEEIDRLLSGPPNT